MLRLNYWRGNPEFAASITVLGDPAEVRISASAKSFISVSEQGLTLAGGFPSRINIQGMPSSVRYGGMLSALPFPLNLVPSTVGTPIPQQVFVPPMMQLMPEILQLSTIASSFVSV
jgi:hypothetical protein